MDKIYLKYMEPPEPPKHIWLTIDYVNLNFRDIDHIKFICSCIPESYPTINHMYKIYQRDKVSSLKIDSPDNKSEPPKIMKKVKRKLKRD
jgi:hypothetical protein